MIKIIETLKKESNINVKNITLIKQKKGKNIYQIISDDNIYRLDINYLKETIEFQEILLNNNINVPKIIFYKETSKNNCIKLSEWIIGNLWSDDSNNLEMFELLGEELAKINSLKYNDKFLVNSDTNSSGVVYTKDKKLFIIDLNTLYPCSDTDPYVVKILTKRIKVKERIDSFLKGYSKIKDTKNIIKMCEERDWRWKK